MRLIILLAFITFSILCTPSCKTIDTKPGEQYDRPVRERPMREHNDFIRGKGRP